MVLIRDKDKAQQAVCSTVRVALCIYTIKEGFTWWKQMCWFVKYKANTEYVEHIFYVRTENVDIPWME